MVFCLGLESSLPTRNGTFVAPKITLSEAELANDFTSFGRGSETGEVTLYQSRCIKVESPVVLLIGGPEF